MAQSHLLRILGDNSEVCKRFRNEIILIDRSRSEKDIPVMGRKAFYEKLSEQTIGDPRAKIIIVIPYERRQTIIERSVPSRSFHQVIDKIGQNRGKQLSSFVVS